MTERPLRDGDPSLPDQIVAIHEEFAAAKTPHALGGAIALAYYAEPRATIDIDLNVFLPVERWHEVADALAPLGVKVEDLEPAALERDGQCRLWWGRTAVDLFFSYDEIHEQMRGKARQVPFADTTIPILSPEHLTVCKAMIDRVKDWLDIEQILVGADDLDVAEIEGWLERMAGPEDPRLKRLRELKAELEIVG